MPCSSPRSRDTPSTARYIAVLIASHVAMALSIGILRICGVLFLSWQNEFGTTASQTAAMQSIMSAVCAFSGVVAGLLTQRFGCRLTGMLAGVLTTSALLFGSWSTSIGQMYVMATVIGVGSGFAYIASLSVVSLYFTKRYKLANSFALSGAGTGSVSIPPLVQLLLDRYGQRGVILITSSLMAHLIVCAALFRSPTGQNRSRRNPKPLKVHTAGTREDHEEGSPNDERRNIHTHDDSGIIPEEPGVSKIKAFCVSSMELEAVTDVEDGQVKSSFSTVPTIKEWIVCLMKRFSGLIGLNVICRTYRFILLLVLFSESMIPYIGFLVIIAPFAQSIGVPASSAAFLLTFVGIGNFVGRFAHGPLTSGKVPALVVYAMCLILAGVSAILVNIDVYAVQAMASFMQGFSIGCSVGVSYVLTRQFVGSENYALCVGWCFSVSGVGTFLGPIVSGRVLDLTGNYSTVFYVMAVMSFICSLQVAIFPLLRRLEPQQLQK